jgi:hypothetical protein
MQQLFVSYAREDLSRVAPLVDLLRAAGFDVFWDQSLPAGVEWAEFLDAKLGTAHCLLVLWTPASVASRWVRTEAHEALQKDKLLPVLLDDVRPPLAFRQIQCFDLTGWHGHRADPRLARLADEVRARADDADPSPPSLTPPSAAPAGRLWLRWAFGAVVAALVLGGATWLLRDNTTDASPPDPTPGASAPGAPGSTPLPADAASRPMTPAADRARCNAINEQIGLNLPVSAADLAFLRRGCRS